MEILNPVQPESKSRFFEELDVFQSEIFGQLRSAYEDEAFCKLVALKIANFKAADFHYTHRHIHLTAYPVQLLVDPSNACQLQCPGCVHSDNQAWKDLFDWEYGVLKPEQFESFLGEVGLFAAVASLYNYGEPLLNKKFPEIVKSAKQRLMFTFTSTNLSLPLKHTDDIITSGLDRMVLSIDGATQETLGKYRRRGNMKTIVENIRKLVDSRRRTGIKKPYLSWQFLTFEHNIHELDSALEMAESLGVDEVYVATPYAVDLDDSSIKIVDSPRQGRYVFNKPNPFWCTDEVRESVECQRREVKQAFALSWSERFRRSGGIEEPGRDEVGAPCQWLYNSLTLDATRRVMPCCIAPTVDRRDKNLVFALLGSDADLINSEKAILARQAFVDTKGYQEAVTGQLEAGQPYCAKCRGAPDPPQEFDMAGYLRVLDERRALSPELFHQIRGLSVFNA